MSSSSSSSSKPSSPLATQLQLTLRSLPSIILTTILTSLKSTTPSSVELLPSQLFKDIVEIGIECFVAKLSIKTLRKAVSTSKGGEPKGALAKGSLAISLENEIKKAGAEPYLREVGNDLLIEFCKDLKISILSGTTQIPIDLAVETLNEEIILTGLEGVLSLMQDSILLEIWESLKDKLTEEPNTSTLSTKYIITRLVTVMCGLQENEQKVKTEVRGAKRKEPSEREEPENSTSSQSSSDAVMNELREYLEPRGLWSSEESKETLLAKVFSAKKKEEEEKLLNNPQTTTSASTSTLIRTSSKDTITANNNNTDSTTTTTTATTATANTSKAKRVTRKTKQGAETSESEYSETENKPITRADSLTGTKKRKV